MHLSNLYMQHETHVKRRPCKSATTLVMSSSACAVLPLRE